MARVKADMIAQDIATKIKHGIYAAGSFLPSENQLTELYGASRATVRKALGELLDLGLIQGERLKGLTTGPVYFSAFWDHEFCRT